MKKNKITVLIAGILGIISGITILILAIMGVDAPKPVWAVFAVVCFINAIYNFINYKKSKNDKH